MKSFKIKYLDCVSIWNKGRRPKYLFTHADLHYGIADECFVQIFVFLLFEAFNVLPGCLYKLSIDAITNREREQMTQKTKNISKC